MPSRVTHIEDMETGDRQMAYQITYETADGTVDGFSTAATKAAATKFARECAKYSAINGPLGVTRWFVESDDATVATFLVAA